ncbi:MULTISPECIES: Hpt domain-containing protein [unclassified Arthrobacter]|uniref:Hpt domain-containing protein n=1 Tax=unclassified Arthrobacter TaxID=235627 RepID=UPI001E578D02|nr:MULTISPECIES: Hpt domain-containing protein [unclassified Arthrobacter]MCC9146147.1 Hpt domain-containing protein [Arthrobacter sp. zg-Y919]MDK1277377.1 Hpt domain-containing protein [Arthrobacter sp. zg.Y919]MDM7990485.1 Hpt domain-containing protein [Arthrobacter sp. zg-Y877]WIB03874.1 Hpt domain-containing protein [Arthrobacter sp. zg-Y919]
MMHRGGQPRLIALGTLLDLSEQMGARTCRQYIGNYLSMWDGRFTRLVQAVEHQDFDAAMDVVLSIKISSHMAGAERLSALASQAQDLVAAYDLAGLRNMVQTIDRCGTETMSFLSASLDVEVSR